MRVSLIIIISVLMNFNLGAQQTRPVIVKAGTRIMDYFPAQERYRYPEFTEGRCILRNGTVNPGRYNYNFLTGEMEFLRYPDTLSISGKEDIDLITIAADTFYYHNGYLELVRSGSPEVFLKKNIIIKEILKKGAFGVVHRGSSFESYTGVDPRGLSYNRIQNEDMVLQNAVFWFFSTHAGVFLRFSRKNVFDAFPDNKDSIKEYLKSNNIDLESREDILKLAGFLEDLL